MAHIAQHLTEHGPHDFLKPEFKTAGIGHSPYRGQHWNVLILEQGHVAAPDRFRLLSDGTLSVAGTLLEPGASEKNQEMHVKVLHAPDADTLSRWQIGLAQADEPGVLAGEVIIVPDNQSTPIPYRTEVTRLAGHLLPHDLDRRNPADPEEQTLPNQNAPTGPADAAETEAMVTAREIYRQHFRGSRVTVPVIRAKSGTINPNGDFVISANVRPILRQKGSGIYTVQVFGKVNGEITLLSQTSRIVAESHPALLPTNAP